MRWGWPYVRRLNHVLSLAIIRRDGSILMSVISVELIQAELETCFRKEQLKSKF